MISSIKVNEDVSFRFQILLFLVCVFYLEFSFNILFFLVVVLKYYLLETTMNENDLTFATGS